MTKTKKKGAGKPALYGKAMKRVNVMLDDESIKFYAEKGNGNLSEGIRKHWRGLTPLALDGATVCRKISHLYIDGVCAECGSPEPPRQ